MMAVVMVLEVLVFGGEGNEFKIYADNNKQLKIEDKSERYLNEPLLKKINFYNICFL